MIPEDSLAVRLLLSEAEAARAQNDRARAIALIRAIYAVIDGIQDTCAPSFLATLNTEGTGSGSPPA